MSDLLSRREQEGPRHAEALLSNLVEAAFNCWHWARIASAGCIGLFRCSRRQAAQRQLNLDQSALADLRMPWLR
jgi:hypothetical protein